MLRCGRKNQEPVKKDVCHVEGSSGRPEAGIDFSSIVLADYYQDGLLCQAEKEGLLAEAPNEDKGAHSRRSRCAQKALSMLVLYDRLILPIDPTLGIRIPRLERDGIVEFVSPQWQSIQDLLEPGEPWNTRCKKDIATISPIRVLTLDFLMRIEDEFVKVLAEGLRVSRRRVYNAMLDFALARFAGRPEWEALSELPDMLTGEDELLELIRRNLDGKMDTGDALGRLKSLMLMASISASYFASEQEWSAKRRVPIATSYCTRQGAGWKPIASNIELPGKIADAFGVVRCALHSEGYGFPKIENIRHALSLREDANLKAFREQLRCFLKSFSIGDMAAACAAQREVHKAKQALDKATKWGIAAEWTSYFALPVSIIETILEGPQSWERAWRFSLRSEMLLPEG